MNKLACNILFIGTVLLSSSSYAVEKIAVVDIKKALTECTEGKHIIEVNKKVYDGYSKEIAEKQAYLKELKDDIDVHKLSVDSTNDKSKALTTKAHWDEETTAFKEAEYSIKANMLNKRAQELNDKLQKEAIEQEKVLMAHIREVLARVSKERGLTIMLDKNNTLISSDMVDVTAEVIQLLDKK